MVAVLQVFEAGVVGEIGQLDAAGGAVALLGDDDLGLAFEVFVLAVVVLLAVDEADYVGVLLDGTGLAEVAEQRLFVAAALLAGTGELRECDTGTFISLARALRPREMAETSWVRFSNPLALEWSRS